MHKCSNRHVKSIFTRLTVNQAHYLLRESIAYKQVKKNKMNYS